MKSSLPLLKFLILIVGMICLEVHQTSAQKIKTRLTKEFLATHELYVIQNATDEDATTASQPEAMNLVELAKASWPEKEIIPIGKDAYHKLENTNDKFHIATSTLTISKGYVKASSVDCIILQKGKVKTNPSKAVYLIYMDFESIGNGIAIERFEYGVRNMAQLLQHYNDKSDRSTYFYKTEDYQQYLSENTLYIREMNLHKRYRDLEHIKKRYPHPVKIVSNEEWAQLIAEKREHALFIDKVGEGDHCAVNIYHANSGKLLLASYPWIGYGFQFGKTFFKKAF